MLLVSEASCGSDSRSIAATAADSGRLFNAAGHSWSARHARRRTPAAPARRWPRRSRPPAAQAQAFDNAGLGADHRDGLANLIVQFARHLAAGSFLRRHQRSRQLAVLRQPQPQPQLLVQFALPLDAGAEQQAGQALGQQRKQQIAMRIRLRRSLATSATPLSRVASSAPCQP